MENAKRTLLLEAILGQTRLAVIEDGALAEIYHDRPSGENLTGNIYLGRVSTVLPGMNAAFVDIGIGKNAFLPASEIQSGARIGDLVKPGQEILVQVVRVGVGDKGPLITTGLTLPGRALALMPGEEGVGVSRKIADKAERERLSNVLSTLLSGTGTGAIARTAAEGLSSEALAAELNALTKQWEDIQNRAAHAIAPKQLFTDANLALHAVRDMLNEDTDAIWTDNVGSYGLLREYAKLFAPQWLDRVRLHKGAVPLFDLYRVDDQLDKALGKRVWLKSGGFLFVEETEALTVIDVNTGKFTGRRELEDTIFKANCEAAEEVMRQLRLRDIGGIVIVDFIDMASKERREELLDILRELSRRDSNRTRVVGITELGLVEITRRRSRICVSRQLFHTCVSCGGTGLEPTHETVARRALRDVWRRRWQGEENPVRIRACPEVAGWLETIGAPAGGDVYVTKDETLAPGEYAVEPADPGKLPEGALILKRG